MDAFSNSYVENPDHDRQPGTDSGRPDVLTGWGLSYETCRCSIQDKHQRLLSMPVIVPRACGSLVNEARALERNDHWLRSHNLLKTDEQSQSFHRTGLHSLAALVSSDGVDTEETALALNQALSLFFLLDDLTDSQDCTLAADADAVFEMTTALKRGVAGCAQVVDKPSLLSPIQLYDVLAMGEGWRDIHGVLAKRGLRDNDFQAAMVHYLDGMIEESLGREQCQHYAVSDYETLRMKVSGVFPAIELHAALRGIELSPVVRKSPIFEQARMLCNLAISYMNDLYSYRKEYEAGEYSNIVLILSKTLSERNAIMATVRSHNGFVQKFYACRDELRASKLWSSQLESYIDVMERWIRGNFEWSAQRTERYSACSSTNLVLGS